MKKLILTIVMAATLFSCSPEDQATDNTQDNAVTLTYGEQLLTGDYSWWNSPYSSQDANCGTSFINLEDDRSTSEIRYTQECIESVAAGDWSLLSDDITLVINSIPYRLTRLYDDGVNYTKIEMINDANGSESTLTLLTD